MLETGSIHGIFVLSSTSDHHGRQDVHASCRPASRVETVLAWRRSMEAPGRGWPGAYYVIK